jgi:sigma-54-interacting transcriptional regulator
MSQQSEKAQTEQTIAHAELQWALSSQSTNVLIIGADEAVVAMVEAYIVVPVTVIEEDGIPPDVAGTCLVPNAPALTSDQQRALLERLDRRSDLRLITLSPVPLFPLVKSGHFAETLYYRLNTITVEWPAAGRDLPRSRPA